MTLEKLGPYRINKKLGEGGMGTVFLATNAETNQRAAVKVLPTALAKSRGFRARFEIEIEALRKLDHPHIVRIYGFGEQDGTLFYAMELVEGSNLEELIDAETPFTWQDAARIGVQLCKALKHAHDRGFIHRDIKPANLMIMADGTVKLSDFGIAKQYGVGGLTMEGGPIGTANFMAPEQTEGKKANERSDLYAVGGVLYAMLAHRPPFVAESLPEMLHFQRNVRPEPITRLAKTRVPRELEIVIMRLLEKNPDERLPNALTLQRSLQMLLDGDELRALQAKEQGDSGTRAASLDDRPRGARHILPPPPPKQEPGIDTMLGQSSMQETVIGGPRPPMRGELRDNSPATGAGDKEGRPIDDEIDQGMDPAPGQEMTVATSAQADDDAATRVTNASPIRSPKPQAETNADISADFPGQRSDSDAPTMVGGGGIDAMGTMAMPRPAPSGHQVPQSDEGPQLNRIPSRPGKTPTPRTLNSRFMTTEEAEQEEVRKQKAKEVEEPFRINVVWVTLGVLVVGVLGAIWYVTRPLGPQKMWDVIDKATKSDSPEDLALVLPVIQDLKRLYPESPHIKDLPPIEDEIMLRKEEKLAIVHARFLSRGEITKSLVESTYLESISLSESNPELAATKLDALLGLYNPAPKDTDDTTLTYLRLAKRRLDRLDSDIKKRAGSDLQMVRHQLDHAEAIAGDSPETARRICNSVITLFEGKAWAVPLVERAKKILNGLPERK